VKWPKGSVNADHWRGVRRYVKVGPRHFDHFSKQLAKCNFWHNPAFTIRCILTALPDCLSDNLVNCSEPLAYLLQAALSQGQHTLFYGFLPELQPRRSNQYEFPHVIGDFHHFIQADAALVSGAVARAAASAFEGFDFFGLAWREPDVDDCLDRNSDLGLALLADPADQALSLYQV